MQREQKVREINDFARRMEAETRAMESQNAMEMEKIAVELELRRKYAPLLTPHLSTVLPLCVCTCPASFHLIPTTRCSGGLMRMHLGEHKIAPLRHGQDA